MIKWLLPQFIGNKNQREINRIRPTVARINEIEEALQREPFDRLLQLTSSWQSHLARYHALDAPPKQLIVIAIALDVLNGNHAGQLTRFSKAWQSDFSRA